MREFFSSPIGPFLGALVLFAGIIYILIDGITKEK